ncbi:Antigen WC1.1 [Larimichthys crocea]|uniref:Uncharacterized protein n=1 Tax=Larimichthys crocea TaxID=215358 RepID=A0ACD3QL78_LARCR|nr:Antigen WC1.1 [Larimichthys crocea]
MMLDMDHMLMVLLVLLWSSGFRAEEVHDHAEPVRLVGGHSRCAGTLEVKLKEWRPVSSYDWTLKEAAGVCRDLDCGSAVSIQWTVEPIDRSVWRIKSNCLQSGSTLKDCVEPWVSTSTFNLTCSDSLLDPFLFFTLSRAEFPGGDDELVKAQMSLRLQRRDPLPVHSVFVFKQQLSSQSVNKGGDAHRFSKRDEALHPPPMTCNDVHFLSPKRPPDLV